MFEIMIISVHVYEYYIDIYFDLLLEKKKRVSIMRESIFIKLFLICDYVRCYTE